MKKMIIIGVSVLVLLIIIGVSTIYLCIKSKRKRQPIVYCEFDFGESYTNITAESKILKFNLTIEYTNEEMLTQLTTNKSKITNNIYEMFRTKSFETLNKTNGQQRMREDILEILLEILQVDNEQVTDVFFTQFILQ